MKKLNLLPNTVKSETYTPKLLIAGIALLTLCVFVYGAAWFKLYTLTKTEQEWEARLQSVKGVDEKLAKMEKNDQEKKNTQVALAPTDNQTFFLFRDIALSKPEDIILAIITTVPEPKEEAKTSDKTKPTSGPSPAVTPAIASSQSLVQIKGQTESLKALSEFTHAIEQLPYVQKVWMQNSFESKLDNQPTILFTLHIALK